MTKDIRTILVPIDFSASAHAALDYAAMLADRFGADIHLVHVCEVPPMMTMDAYAVTSLDWNRKLGEAAERDLATATARLKDAAKVSTEVLFGNPAKCIVTAATTNRSDLIVMGTHGHGAVMHLLMGNVAERVVRTAPCPVLTVREQGAAEKQEAHQAASHMVA